MSLPSSPACPFSPVSFFCLQSLIEMLPMPVICYLYSNTFSSLRSRVKKEINIGWYWVGKDPPRKDLLQYSVVVWVFLVKWVIAFYDLAEEGHPFSIGLRSVGRGKHQKRYNIQGYSSRLHVITIIITPLLLSSLHAHH